MWRRRAQDQDWVEQTEFSNDQCYWWHHVSRDRKEMGRNIEDIRVLECGSFQQNSHQYQNTCKKLLQSSFLAADILP